MDAFKAATGLMREQLGHDVVMALATCSNDGVSVRNVDGYYKDGCIYVATYGLSRKMRDIAENPDVAVCKDLMCAKGVGANLGNPRDKGNEGLRLELMDVFSSFYSRHVNEDDPNTCILQIRLSTAVAFSRDTKYVIDYLGGTATSEPFVNDIV